MVGLDEFYVARGQGLSKVFLCQKFRYLLISKGLFRRLLGFAVYDELEAPTGEYFSKLFFSPDWTNFELSTSLDTSSNITLTLGLDFGFEFADPESLST